MDDAAHYDRIARECRRREHLAHDHDISDNEHHYEEISRSRSRSPHSTSSHHHAESTTSHHASRHSRGPNREHSYGLLTSTAERGTKLPSTRTCIRKPSLRKKQPKKKLTPAQLVYSSCKQYKDILIPIVNQEVKYQKRMQMEQTAAEIEVKWTAPDEMEFFNPWQDVDRSPSIGDAVHLTSTEKGCSIIGTITSLSPNKMLPISVRLRKKYAMGQGNNFRVYIIYNSTSFEHMKHAIKRFEKCRRNADIREFLLGQHVLNDVNEYNISLRRNFSVKGLGRLNESQNKAIRTALSQPLSLIQGPPGTGKTITAASLVHFVVTRQKRKVLVCASSNTAVNNICEKIATTGLNVVRVCAKAFERHLTTSQNKKETAHSYQSTSLQHKLASHPRYHDLMKRNKDSRKYHSLKDKYENEILQAADVICCTCVTAAKVSRYKFEMVLIDECGQATEPECMIPIALCGCKKVVLIGDQCQLGPIVMDKVAASTGLNKSLFERLIELGRKPILLDTQYRMHPFLSKFPSQQFYVNCLVDGVKPSERTPVERFPWPDFHKPTFFWDVKGQEDSTDSHSFMNLQEAVCTTTVLSMLLDNNTNSEKSDIGVITPYNGQKKLIKYLSKGTNVEEIEIDSVDAFQGREKDYIIFSCVRSNQQGTIGFLHDHRRLNVALTRARRGLIIIGNADLLLQDDSWYSLIQCYSKQGLLIQGDLENGTYRRIIHTSPIIHASA